MPSATKQPCSHPLCSVLVEGGTGGKCGKHRPQNGWQARPSSSDHLRPSSGRWAKLKAAVMQRDMYLCQSCQRNGIDKQGSEVDHVVPLSEGGTNNLDNLQCICRSCHREKTREESIRAVRRKLSDGNWRKS